jgi:FMNH2-dependent dimethyl sulfone monooxygenase
MVRVLLAGDSRTNADEFRAGVMTRKLIAGWGSVPMVGTPEPIVDQFFALRKTGVDGVALSWFTYEEGLQQFNEQILPLLVDAGLRR